MHRQTIFAIAEKLGKMVWEVESEMSNSELLEWCAYFKIKNEHEKAEMEKAKQRR